MIESVEMMNFLSHQETLINLDGGVTVFIGHNGAGKSGVIDAVTFALFGRHTRKSNRSLVRWGQTQGYAGTVITAGGRRYKAVRKIDKRGGLEAQFSRDMSGGWVPVAAGERKQFGESMTGRIEAVIGLDYEKLRIASIVQQGELASIIRAKPKEFKELINSVIGIDRLDVASDGVKEVVKEFRASIRDMFSGRDDTHLDALRADLSRARGELAEAAPERDVLAKRRREVVAKLATARGMVEAGAPNLEKTRHLAERRAELTGYAQEAVRTLMREVAEGERRIRECAGCFDVAGGRDFEAEIRGEEDAAEEARRRMRDLAGKKASLEERLNLAGRLHLRDGRCPVCDTKVARLHPMFQEGHLRDEIADVDRQTGSWAAAARERARKRDGIAKQQQLYREAQAVLSAHSIRGRDELEALRRDTEAKKAAIPTGVATASPAKLAGIDAHAGEIYGAIKALESETRGFDEAGFSRLKQDVDRMQREVSDLDQRIGAAEERVRNAEGTVGKTSGVISELETVHKYVAELEGIRTSVFDRNGAVATSLRSWALGSISANTSDYLMKLNTKVHRVHLSESARDVSIRCHSNKETLDIESLSGGEQVAVALALRLGMASLMGASGLNTIILDEPTAHLDAERKKALVGVLSGLSDVSDPAAGRMQFIIVTHDAEIFEDSHVEQIYKFESSGAAGGGSTVVDLAAG